MNIEEFSHQIDLHTFSEIEKVVAIEFFFHSIDVRHEFTIDDVADWFKSLSFANLNKSRLKKRISESRKIIKASDSSHFKLSAKAIPELETKYGKNLKPLLVTPKSNDVLDSIIWDNTRGYIESLAKQINCSYENCIFDGCAVLMRRLMEILLIQTYRHLSIDSQIRGADGNILMLEKICSNAVSNTILSLSRTSKSNLNSIRDLGNFSAHKIEYIANQSDIDKCIVSYRGIIEELMFKSALKK